MSLFSNLVAGPPPRPWGWESGPVSMFVGGPFGTILNGRWPQASDSGESVTEERSLNVGAAFACISFISRNCGMLPRNIVLRDDKSRVQRRDPEFRHLWGRPNASTTPMSFWETLFASVEGWGNGYVWNGRDDRIRYDPLKPWLGLRELWHLYPQRVDVGVFNDGTKGFRLDRTIEQPYTSEEISHIPGLSIDGVRGLSPARVGAQALGHSIAAEKFSQLFFKNGSTLSGLITSEAVVDPTAARQLMDDWEDEHQGLNNAHLMGVIGGNAKYERIGIPPEDAQMLQTRGFEREEVVQFYGPIPHHLLGWKSNTSNFGTGIEQQNIGVLTFVLLNRLRRVEEFVDEFLLPPEMQFRFSVNAFMRGDMKSRALFYKEMRNMGLFSADGILELEDMPPRGIADDFLNPSNFQRIEARSGQVIPAQISGATGATPPAKAPVRPPVRAARVLEEARCSCGALLGKNVGSADLWCLKCKAERLFRGGWPVLDGAVVEDLRDGTDMAEALWAELEARLFPE